MGHAAQSLWDVPEGDVDKLRLHNQVELVRVLFDLLHLVLGQVHQTVHVVGEPVGSLGAPLQPQLEDVVVAAALDHLVARVVVQVVELVGHEQILSGHLVAAHQEALKGRNESKCQ